MKELTQADIERLKAERQEIEQGTGDPVVAMDKYDRDLYHHAPALLEAAEYGKKAQEFFKDLDCRYRDFGNNPRLEIVLKNAKAAGLLEGE